MKTATNSEIPYLDENDVEVIAPSSIRSTRFTDESFEDANVMVYEKSNSFSLSYYGMTRVEQNLLCAGLVSAYDVNKREPYDQYAIDQGIQVSVPIRDVARMMGYNLDDRSYYKTIKRAADRLSNQKSIMIEDKFGTGFSVFNIIAQIDYNYNKTGHVKFSFSPGASKLFLNNDDNFTLYSLILRNKIENGGQNAAVRMYEMLETDLFKVKSQNKPLRRYYDFVDLRCKLFLINTNNEMVQKILANKRYSTKELENNNELAYERLMRIEGLDSITRKNIQELKNSKRYKDTIEYKKSEEYKAIKAQLRKLKSGPEYEALYQEKILPVEQVETEMQNLNNSIVCQYSEWSDFKKRIIVPSQKAFLEAYHETDLMNLMFEYSPVYYKHKVIGVIFTIYTVEQYQQKEKEKGVQMSIFDYMIDRNIEQSASRLSIYENNGANKTGIKKKLPKKKEKLNETMDRFEKYINTFPNETRVTFPAVDLLKLSKLADFSLLQEKYDLMIKQGNAKNPIAWMTSALKEDWREVKDNYSIPKAESLKNKNAANRFNQFPQNNYDFEALEEELLSNNNLIDEKNKE